MRPRPNRPPAAPSRRPRRVWLRPVGLALLLALGAGAAFVWRDHRVVARVQAGLPAMPDLSGQPAILTEQLAEAAARTRSARTAAAGLADLGRLYHANNFPDEAAACWRLLRTEQPAEARWCYYLADLSRITGAQADVTALLEETLRLAPDYSPARLQLANLRFKSGEHAEAARHYRLRLEQVPQDPHARLGLVRIAQLEGRSDDVRSQLEELLRDSPHFATAHNLYAEILAADGDEAGAARHRWLGAETLRYRDAADPWLDELQEWCHDYGRLCALGTLEMQTENRARAAVLFERAIRLRPAEPAAYELLASLHLKHSDAAAARDLLEKAIPRFAGKKSPLPYTLLGQAYRALQQPAEAVRVAHLGLAQAGEQPELLDALGLGLAASGRHEEAVAAWQRALARAPDDAGINYNLATSLLALGRLDDALAALDRSLTLQPTFLPTLILRAEIELEAGHLEGAEKYLQPAHASQPNDPRIRRLLATWYLKSGAAAEASRDPVAAEKHYRDGLALDADHAELQVSLGVFCLVQSRPADAIAPLAAYHRLQPENAEGCLFLGQAYAAAGRREEAREILTKGAQLAERTGRTRTAQHCRRLLQQL
jgi:tetratricopeptide (TPR) repeat protein